MDGTHGILTTRNLEPPSIIKSYRKPNQEYKRRKILGEEGEILAIKSISKSTLRKNPLNKEKTLAYMIKKRQRITEAEVRFFMRQLLDACDYMHKMFVIHRDLKLSNLFLTNEMKVKIGDFGLAAQLERVVLFGHDGHSFEADLWSLGPPFQKNSDSHEIYRRIKEGAYEFPTYITDVSKEAKRITPQKIPLSALFITPTFDYHNQSVTIKSQTSYASHMSIPILETCYTTLKSEFKNSQEKKKNIKDILVGNVRSVKSDLSITPRVFINKWMDYSKKYGFGYQLTDGSTGIYFDDDNTTLIIRTLYTVKEYPKFLTKKFFTLQKFEKYMKETLVKENTYTYVDRDRTRNMVFMKKFKRSRHAMLFCLSNYLVQIVFFNHERIILTEEGRVVTHINEKDVTNTYTLLDILEGNDQTLINRLEYKDNNGKEDVEQQRRSKRSKIN
ncbi:6572_t:CDS:10 [Diversispora eburnea]|uniref:6572_t:CDS:1 n=1 Tax=Diversispora eburnea TaxID=1213867 RepID=A0A9N8VPI4_9GLOM|nr:6572_t:CDS:10 [Diversispora eburnea]